MTFKDFFKLRQFYDYMTLWKTKGVTKICIRIMNQTLDLVRFGTRGLSSLLLFSWLRTINFDFCNNVKDKAERREAHTSACRVAVSKISRLSQSFGFARCAFFRRDFALSHFPLFSRRPVSVSYQLPGSGKCAWCWVYELGWWQGWGYVADPGHSPGTPFVILLGWPCC